MPRFLPGVQTKCRSMYYVDNVLDNAHISMFVGSWKYVFWGHRRKVVMRGRSTCSLPVLSGDVFTVGLLDPLLMSSDLLARGGGGSKHKTYHTCVSRRAYVQQQPGPVGM